jgi:hypothetical protein
VEGAHIFHCLWGRRDVFARLPHLWVVWPHHAWSTIAGRVDGHCLSGTFSHAGGNFVGVLVARDANVRLYFVDVDWLPAACNRAGYALQ